MHVHCPLTLSGSMSRQQRWPSVLVGYFWLLVVVVTSVNLHSVHAARVYDAKRLEELREEVRSMFYHGYDSYMRYAYPLDELRPLSCDGVDTWGSYSLTLIDTLDTLAVVGNYSEFRRVAQLIIENAQFDLNINVSVFETNIRIIGGLLSAHLLSHKAGMELEKGWPCSGPLLRLAEVVARKLLPAFDTPSGLPFGTVNLRYGVPIAETPITCTAGVGTFIVEFGSLSRLTGDPIYEKVALRALHSLYAKRSVLDLVGNHIDTQTGKWTAVDSGIGAGVDSYFEYLVKGAILFQRPELMHMFKVHHRAVEKHLGKGGWYIWSNMNQGHVSATTFQSLETFWPGMLSLIGEFKTGLKSMANYHRILKQYGGLPELYNILQGKATNQREGFPLRPELMESAMYLYRATGDTAMLELGEDMLHSIEYNARTECGYATIRDVTTLTLEDRMESFFLAETVKYLYLLFDPDNFIHSEGEDYSVIEHPFGKCTVYSGGYIFNTEAHPIDPSALSCCTGIREAELHDEIHIIDEFTPAAPYKGRGKKKRKLRKKKRQDIKTESSQEKPVINDEEKDEKELIDILIEEAEELYMQGTTYSPNENPLLEWQTKGKCLSLQKQVNRRSSSVQDSNITPDGAEDTESIVIKLLRRLFDEKSKGDVEVQKHVSEPILSPLGKGNGLQIVSPKEVEELQKLVQNYETDANKILKSKEFKARKKESLEAKGTATVEIVKENRIRSQVFGTPDLDLIFGTGGPSRSLSFYFSLKWLRSFPDLIRQLIPSERFDIQAFYTRMNQDFSPAKFAEDFNLTYEWFDDYAALRCPNIDLVDRFIFMRTSAED